MSWEQVTKKFSFNYLRKLAIEHHIVELNQKMLRFLAKDVCPFEQEQFNKELADLYWLLEIHKTCDNRFQEMVLKRRNSFILKYVSEEHGYDT